MNRPASCFSAPAFSGSLAVKILPQALHRSHSLWNTVAPAAAPLNKSRHIAKNSSTWSACFGSISHNSNRRPDQAGLLAALTASRYPPPAVPDRVLVQREMECRRSLLASISAFRRPSLNDNTAHCFKNKIRLAPIHTTKGVAPQKRNWPGMESIKTRFHRLRRTV
jgi:hypothetical protein